MAASASTQCQGPYGAVGAAYTIAAGQAFRWTEEGYVPSRAIRHADGLLTPPSTLMVLRAGYRPVLHPIIQFSIP
jgi:hypothetical protein